jgi:hypothetical protein
VIVRPDGEGVVLITQPDHARLARRMMSGFVARGLLAAGRRRSILHAIEEHDNGWREVDGAPMLGDDGRVLDFVTAPLEVRQAIWPRGVRRLAADPTAAALVAEHAIQIYSRFRGSEAWAAFFAGVAALRDEFAARAALTVETLARDYFFLRIADLMSLVFCAGWDEPQELEDHVITRAGDAVIVTPDPFAGATQRVEVRGRRLTATRFASAAEATRAFGEAAVVTLEGVVKGDARHRQSAIGARQSGGSR